MKRSIGTFEQLANLKTFRFEHQSTDFKIKIGEFDVYIQSVNDGVVETIGVIRQFEIDNAGFTFIFRYHGLPCSKRVEFSDLFYVK